MLHTGAERFVGNVEKCQPVACASVWMRSVDKKRHLDFPCNLLLLQEFSPHFFATTSFGMNQTVINTGIDKEKSDVKISTFSLIC